MQDFSSQPASRNTDPLSSHLAEAEINDSGSRESQAYRILEIVSMNPGLTSREMVDFCRLDRYQIARRLADLKSAGIIRQGIIRKCRVGGRKSVTWYPVGGHGEQIKLF